MKIKQGVFVYKSKSQDKNYLEMLENSCRVCLSAAEPDLIDLFTLKGEETLAGQLKLCCGIEPQQNDHLPQKICQNCLQQLTTAWELRKRCIDTDILLRNVETKVEDSQEAPISDSNPADVLLCKLEEQSVVEEYLDEFMDDAEPPKIRSKVKSKRKKIRKRLPEPEAILSSSGRGSQKPNVHDLTCVFCDEVFATRFKKNSHLRAQHSSELFCNVCKKPKPSVISTAKCLKRHKLGLAWSILCQVNSNILQFYSVF